MLRWLLPLAIAVFLIGCDASASLNGQWVGKVELSAEDQKQLDEMPEGMKEMMGSLADMTINLNLKEDKTYTMSMAGASQFETTGKWELSEGSVILTPDQGGGPGQMAGAGMTLEQEGSRLVTTQPGSDSKMIFTKS